MKQLSLLYEIFSKMRSISSAFLTSIILRIVTLQSTSAALQIVLTNDDGWAVANIRAQFNALSNAGYDVVLSSPAVDQSGTGSLEAPAVPVVLGCEFDSCPPLSPATGSDASNALLNYYNSFPASAVNFGIATLAPRFFGKAPDLIVSGPNVGSNTGISVLGSGTVGAASKAALDGIPSIAFSGSSGSQVSFTTLTNATDPNTVSAQVYAALTVQLTGTLLASPAPILPPGVSLNVNYPAISDTCSDPSAFSFVLTRIFEDPLVEDVETCGSDHLPTEGDVIAEAGCKASVSVFDASTKLDANIANQTIVLEKLASLLTCA